MLEQGGVTLNTEISADKSNWQMLQTILETPQPETDDPAKPDIPAATGKIIQNDGTDSAAEDFSQKLTAGDMLINVIASLGNGGGYLQRLNQYTGNAMLLAGITAAFLSFLFGILGSVLFGSCYNVSVMKLCMHCLLGILLSGVIFWGGNVLLRKLVKPEKQFVQMSTLHWVFLVLFNTWQVWKKVN